jgi:hypothetical protein
MARQPMTLGNMRANGVCTLAALLLAFAGVSAVGADELDVDWKLYGTATIAANNYACFYDAKGVVQQPEGHLRVWTKCIAKRVMNSNEATTKKIIESAAQKIERGYVPPLIAIGKVQFQEIAGIVGMEEAANLGNLEPQSKILYEFDCSKQMLRELSITLDIADKKSFQNKPGDWRYIAPETNGANLSHFLCRTVPHP